MEVLLTDSFVDETFTNVTIKQTEGTSWSSGLHPRLASRRSEVQISAKAKIIFNDLILQFNSNLNFLSLCFISSLFAARQDSFSLCSSKGLFLAARHQGPRGRELPQGPRRARRGFTTGTKRMMRNETERAYE